jgi:hypothetical protein
MYKIYIILIFILVSKNYVLCMDAKDATPKTGTDLALERYEEVSAELESLWRTQFEKNRIINEFLGEELVAIMVSAIQFVHSVNNLAAERRRVSVKDSSYLGKKILSLSLFYNIGDVVDRMLVLYISLSELEYGNPIIATTFHIKSSFSLSFRQRVEDVIRRERAKVTFGIARIKLINSMKRLQYLAEAISKKISSIKDSEYHLKLLELLRDISLKFQREISLRNPTFRSKIRSSQSCKPNKRVKIKN